MFGSKEHEQEQADRWDDPDFLWELTQAALAEPEPDRHLLPPGLDQLEPAAAMAFLSALDIDRLSGHDRVTALQAWQRLTSQVNAHTYQTMASVHQAVSRLDSYTDLDEELVTDAAATEIRFALHLTRRAADTELDLALSLRDRHPRLAQALAVGDLDLRRVKVISGGTDHLTVNQARNVCDRALETASRLTTGQLAAHIRRLCIDADPGDAHHRYETAIDQRRVLIESTPDGTAHLLALDLPPDRVAAAADHINRLARNLRRHGEPRTMDQLRADVLCDLLTGTDTGGTGGVVTLTIDLETLTELAEHPGDLAGYGPVISDIARQTVEHQHQAEWRYIVTHPDSGQPLTSGTTRRRPTNAQTRYLHALSPTCATPGCRVSATQCDLDHTQAWSNGGPTTIDNLTPLCRHDHRIRHLPGFDYTTQPDGDHTWTTPLDHTHTTSGRPPP